MRVCVCVSDVQTDGSRGRVAAEESGRTRTHARTHARTRRGLHICRVFVCAGGGGGGGSVANQAGQEMQHRSPPPAKRAGKQNERSATGGAQLNKKCAALPTVAEGMGFGTGFSWHLRAAGRGRVLCRTHKRVHYQNICNNPKQRIRESDAPGLGVGRIGLGCHPRRYRVFCKSRRYGARSSGREKSDRCCRTGRCKKKQRCLWLMWQSCIYAQRDFGFAHKRHQTNAG